MKSYFSPKSDFSIYEKKILSPSLPAWSLIYFFTVIVNAKYSDFFDMVIFIFFFGIYNQTINVLKQYFFFFRLCIHIVLIPINWLVQIQTGKLKIIITHFLILLNHFDFFIFIYFFPFCFIAWMQKSDTSGIFPD